MRLVDVASAPWADGRERAFERFSWAACAEHYFYADLTGPR
jgi:hypothetical protein